MTLDSADDSNLESDVRFEIESNHEASQVPSFKLFLKTVRTECWVTKTIRKEFIEVGPTTEKARRPNVFNR